MDSITIIIGVQGNGDIFYRCIITVINCTIVVYIFGDCSTPASWLDFNKVIVGIIFT